jgi:hypothetical protein
MNANFFANYKEFIVIPLVEQKFGEEEFNPQKYKTNYIITLSLYDSLLSNWNEANKHEVDVARSIEKVLEDFNRNQKGIYHLQLLEFENDKSYFVLALSCKSKIENQESNDLISNIFEKMISNPFYVGQSWYKLTGQKGRRERKLFCYSFREYTV